jgi:acetyl-CoA carboxylase carboxyltransferase component
MKNLAFILTLAATAHASGPIFTAILGGSYQSYISAVASDSQGNTFVAGMTSARVYLVHLPRRHLRESRHRHRAR